MGARDYANLSLHRCARRTYVYSRCTLERQFGGEGACEYSNIDLSWLDIRLGE